MYSCRHGHWSLSGWLYCLVLYIYIKTIEWILRFPPSNRSSKTSTTRHILTAMMIICLVIFLPFSGLLRWHFSALGGCWEALFQDTYLIDLDGNWKTGMSCRLVTWMELSTQLVSVYFHLSCPNNLIVISFIFLLDTLVILTMGIYLSHDSESWKMAMGTITNIEFLQNAVLW